MLRVVPAAVPVPFKVEQLASENNLTASPLVTPPIVIDGVVLFVGVIPLSEVGVVGGILSKTSTKFTKEQAEVFPDRSAVVV